MIATTFLSFHKVTPWQRRETFSFAQVIIDFSTAITFVTLLP